MSSSILVKVIPSLGSWPNIIFREQGKQMHYQLTKWVQSPVHNFANNLAGQQHAPTIINTIPLLHKILIMLGNWRNWKHQVIFYIKTSYKMFLFINLSFNLLYKRLTTALSQWHKIIDPPFSDPKNKVHFLKSTAKLLVMGNLKWESQTSLSKTYLFQVEI